MLSLRVRLPLVFLAGIALAGVVTTVIAIRLFKSFAHDQALSSLNREANGIAALYTTAIDAELRQRRRPRARRKLAAKNLELATGDKIYFVGPRDSSRARQRHGAEAAAGPARSTGSPGKSLTFEFTPPNTHRTLPRRRETDLPRQAVGRRDRRRDAEDRRQPARQRPDQAARGRRPARPARRRAARAGTSRAASCGPCCSSRDAADEVATATTPSRCPRTRRASSAT